MKIFNWFNPIRTIYDYFYTWQLLDYDIEMLPNFYKKIITGKIIAKRSKLAFTNKIKLSIICSIFFDVSLAFIFPPYILFYRLAPVGIIIVMLLSQFTLYVIEKFLIKKASTYVKNLNPNLKIIAITGSYGKTTTKNLIFNTLSKHYKSQLIEGNINTTLGIINWINKNLKSDTKFLVAEMGAYRAGEIKKSCRVLPPDIAVITAIGEQHLARYKTLQNIIKAKEEIIQNAKLGAILYTTEAVKDIIKTNKAIKVVRNNSDYEQTNKALAQKILSDLKINEAFIKKDFQNFSMERRKSISKINSFLVIDDSYNINLESAKKSFKIASHYKKIIAITGGIPECGNKSELINVELGNLLSRNTDESIVLKTDFAKDIIQGIKKVGESKFTTVDNLQTAWNVIIEKHEKDKDNTIIILFPELTDLYY